MTLDEKTKAALVRLKLEDDFTQFRLAVEGELQAMTDRMIYNQETDKTPVLQGACRALTEIVKLMR